MNQHTDPIATQPAAEYTLECPHCGQRVAVDAAMRETLLRTGCVLCTGTVAPGDFD